MKQSPNYGHYAPPMNSGSRRVDLDEWTSMGPCYTLTNLFAAFLVEIAYKSVFGMYDLYDNV